MFFKVSPSTGSLMSAFIHDTRRGQAAGGIRNWRYSTVGQMITEYAVVEHRGETQRWPSGWEDDGAVTWL